MRVTLPTIALASQLCAGEAHACAVNGGEIWCWGLSDNGRLGVTAAERATATPVQLPTFSSPVQSITCGAQHTCARLDDGTVHCWGANNFRQLGVTLPAGVNSRVGAEAVPGLGAVTAIAARLYTTCAVRIDGSVVCWGANLAGKLGTGAGGEASATPTAVAGVTGAAGIAAGSLHFCAWGTGGVQCWGDDNEAQLGQGMAAMAPRGAVVVAGVRGPVGVAGGLGHTCVSVHSEVSHTSTSCVVSATKGTTKRRSMRSRVGASPGAPGTRTVAMTESPTRLPPSGSRGETVMSPGIRLNTVGRGLSA